MRFIRLTVLLILAAFLAAEPVVHSHPLPGSDRSSSDLSSPNLCAICAVGADRVVVAAPVILAPAIVIERVVVTPSQPITAEVRVSLASRAPPAA